jgi:preprotein translocase subunit Sec63
MIVLSIVQNRPLIDRIIFTLLGILIIGILQEMIQAISINSLRLKDTLFDLIIDIMAGAIPLAIIALRKKLNN